MQIALIIAMFIWPALVGVGVTFQRQPDRWRWIGASVAIAPAAIMFAAASMMGVSARPNISDLVMTIILTLIAGLFFFLGRRLAKPFSESWREYRDAKVEETFK